jgi:hypothetical protein
MDQLLETSHTSTIASFKIAMGVVVAIVVQPTGNMLVRFRGCPSPFTVARKSPQEPSNLVRSMRGCQQQQ